MDSTWTNGRILQQVFGHLQKYMTILYNFVDLSSQKKDRLLLHIVVANFGRKMADGQLLF